MTRIDVIDNHGQFTHLEQRALRDMGVDVDLVDNETPPEEIDADGLVLSGGPDIDRTGNCSEYLDLDVPVLGICLGMQFIATELDGEVGPGEYGGYADVTVDIVDDDDPLIGSLAPEPRHQIRGRGPAGGAPQPRERDDDTDGGGARAEGGPERLNQRRESRPTEVREREQQTERAEQRPWPCHVEPRTPPDARVSLRPSPNAH